MKQYHSELLQLKDYRYHAFPNTEFSYFLTIDTRQYELPNYLLKIGGHRPLKGRYDVICNDVIFHISSWGSPSPSSAIYNFGNSVHSRALGT